MTLTRLIANDFELLSTLAFNRFHFLFSNIELSCCIPARDWRYNHNSCFIKRLWVEKCPNLPKVMFKILSKILSEILDTIVFKSVSKNVSKSALVRIGWVTTKRSFMRWLAGTRT